MSSKKDSKRNDQFEDNKDEFEDESDEEVLPEFIEITDVLDLHGFFPEQVPEMVDEFIRNALELNLCNLKIIHGKGKSRLKWEVREALKAHANVAWFGDAPPESGGWGATLIELKETET